MSEINEVSWYRGFIQGKTRIVMAWIFSVALILSVRDYPTWPGIIVCFLGATLRYWASAYLRKDQYPAVGGPYALTRNPLYLGTYLMAIGTALAIQNYILAGIATVLFGAVYHFIILDEENKLKKIFGEPYLTYQALVPRFFPRLFPQSSEKLKAVNPTLEHHQYSVELGRKNKDYEAYASFAGLIGFVTLVAFLWKNFLSDLF